MPLIPAFTADYAGAIVVPANFDNAYSVAGHGGVPNKPRAFILHTPEEAADNNEVTPRWFQQYHPDSRGSTHYYLDNDGDVYQCVPEAWGAIANGFNPGVPQRVSYPAWAAPHSLNWQTISVEIEGYAHNIASTLNQVQFDALVRLVRNRCQFYGIPLDREHINGHYQLAFDRTDPGASFPWARFIDALSGGGDMFNRLNGVAGFFSNRVFSASKDNFMALRTDFPGLPQTAKAVELDIRIDPTTTGDLVLKDGNKAFADDLNRNKSQAVVKVIPGPDGKVFFDVLNAPVKFLQVGIVGYWS